MYVNVAQINPQQSRFSQCLSKGCVPHVLRLTVAITTDEEEDFLLLLLLLELFFVAVGAEASTAIGVWESVEDASAACVSHCL